MRKTLRHVFTENILLKLLSLLAAFVLWMVILNIDDPVNTRIFNNVQVTILNESVVTNSGMIYQIENGTNTVSVTVTARRSVLSRIRVDNVRATADMNNLTLDSLVPIHVEVTGYESSVESAVANPNNLQISIEKNGTVRLPIAVSTVGDLADGCFIESTSVTPGMLVISGPESQVDKVGSISLRVDVTGLAHTETLMGTLLYYDKNGDPLDATVLTSNVPVDDIYATIKVLPIKEIPIEVETIGTLAEGFELVGIDCEPKTVSVIGKAEALEQIDKLVIRDEQLDLEGADNILEKVCDLNEYLPEGIKLADGVSDKVMITVRIERSGTALIEYPVGSIVVEHAPAGCKVTYELQSELKLEFTGNMQDLEKLHAEDIKVSIDLSEAELNSRTEVPVKVEAPNGCQLDKPVTVVVNLVKE